MSDLQAALSELRALKIRCDLAEKKSRALEALLAVAVCPNARNSGHEEAWQCQWCDERKSLTEHETGGGK